MKATRYKSFKDTDYMLDSQVFYVHLYLTFNTQLWRSAVIITICNGENTEAQRS